MKHFMKDDMGLHSLMNFSSALPLDNYPFRYLAHKTSVAVSANTNSTYTHTHTYTARVCSDRRTVERIAKDIVEKSFLA